MNEILLIVLAYLIGSIPTSIWVSRKFFNIDIRDYGSGNAGATNTFRVLGPKWGSFVMMVDVLKGVVATSLYILLPYYLMNEWDRTNFMIGLGLASVLGHIFPIWANFKGGKGVATACGILFGINWILGAATLSTWIIVAMFMRYSSLAALAAAIFGPIYFVFLFGFQPMGLALLAVCALLIWRHRSNIQNLLNGKESRIGSKKTPT